MKNLYNKEEYIKNKIKQTYIDKSKKNKELVNSLQMDLFDDTPKEHPITTEPTLQDLENEFKIVTKDGKKKRFLEQNYKTTLKKCANISRELKSRNLPYLAKIDKVRGERGDDRIYDAIVIYKK